MIQQPKPSYNFTITHSNTTYNTSRRLSTSSTCSTDSTISTSPRLLPSVLIGTIPVSYIDIRLVYLPLINYYYRLYCNDIM